MIAAFALRWSLMKGAVGTLFDISSDALHVLVGGLLFIGAGVALRWPSPFLPWLILLAIEGGNEAVDLIRFPGGAENDMAASVHDMMLTMALPTLLALVAHGRGPAPGLSPLATRPEPLPTIEKGTES